MEKGGRPHIASFSQYCITLPFAPPSMIAGDTAQNLITTGPCNTHPLHPLYAHPLAWHNKAWGKRKTPPLPTGTALSRPSITPITARLMKMFGYFVMSLERFIARGSRTGGVSHCKSSRPRHRPLSGIPSIVPGQTRKERQRESARTPCTPTPTPKHQTHRESARLTYSVMKSP
jgi:hypothetical protein